MRLFPILLITALAAGSLSGQTIRPGDKSKGYSGNPVFDGWYADPEGIIYDDTYWIFPTWSDQWGEAQSAARLTDAQRRMQKNTINPQYLKQTFLDAFSSKDLITWEKHPKVLDVANITWAAYSVWAPSVIRANGQYYLFFSANDIQNDSQPGGIGVAVADRPEGPYRDAIGKPLINAFHNGAQPIDQFVFRDDDGRYYLYYGGWRHCNIARLRPDLLGIEPFDDGTLFREITPDQYVEGPFMLKRNGKYYLMWSEGGWTGPDYSVAYAIGDHPAGPFRRIGKILQQNPDVATGAGHHSVIRIPGTDEHYIIYHRRPLGDKNGNHREVCVDRMEFNGDGTIRPVQITFSGVGRRAIPRVESASVTIDLDRKGPEIPKGLSGIFMEEINHGFDGGIYAELVQNRSFEEGILPPGMKLVRNDDGTLRMELISLPPGVPEERWPMPWPWNGNCGWDPSRELVGWSMRNENGAVGKMELTGAFPMNEASGRSLHITIPKSGSGNASAVLVNSGYWGMNLRAGEPYRFTCYLRPFGFSGTIRVCLEAEDGRILAESETLIVKRSKKWSATELALKPSASDPKGRLAIRFTGAGELQVDWVSLFPPTFRNTPNGLRPDLAKYLADLKPDFIRYPGGCYVEGLSWESAPDWRKMVCPPQERPGMWGYWKYRSTDGFGYHEFLEFCEQIGADAMFVAFAGMTVHPDNNWPLENIDTLVQATLDAIEYAIGPADSKWGSRRVAMGHPAPFPLKYVEIGNEHYPAVYGDYYVRFRNAIKARYPEITVIMSMYWSGLNQPAIARAGDQNIDMVDEHAYRDAQWIRARFDYFDRYRRTPWKVYVGEYASHHAEGDLLCALSDATWIMMMEKNGDLVKMASYAPLFCNVNDRSWGVNLIEYDASRSFAHTAYYVQKIFNEHRPQVNLDTRLETGRPPDTVTPLLGGRIGLGSWKTRVEYRDLQVLDARGNLLFRDEFKDLGAWEQPVEGVWETGDGSLKQTDPQRDACRIFLKGIAPETGEIRVKARRTGGSEGFLILFNGVKDDRFFFANYGAAGNAFHEVQAWGAPEGFAYKRFSSTSGAIESDRWYDLRIVIRRDRAEMYLDGRLVSSAGLAPLESLFSVAGYDSKNEQVVVKVVNYHPVPVETTLHLKGSGRVGALGRHIAITSGSLDDRNTLEEPLKVIPVEKPRIPCASDMSVTVPPYSVNLYLIPVTFNVK